MFRARLTECIRDLGSSFTSDLARKDSYAFSIRQLKLLSDTSKLISKTDPLSGKLIDGALFNTYINNSVHILEHVRLGRSTYPAIPSQSELKGRALSEKAKVTQHMAPPFTSIEVPGYYPVGGSKERANSSRGDDSMSIYYERMVQDSLLSFLIAASVHGDNEVKARTIMRYISSIDLRRSHPSSVIALIGALHKSGSCTNELISSFVKSSMEFILKRRNIVKAMTDLESSLLLWHKTAISFMYLYPFNLRQFEILLNRTLTGVLQHFKYSLDGKSVISTPLETLKSHIDENIKRTLKNLSQALHLIGLGYLRKLKLETLILLNKLLLLQGELNTNYRAPSDVHVKVTFTLKDILDQKYNYQHEVNVNNTTYTIDTLLTLK